MKVKDITKSGCLTLAQVGTIPAVMNEWMMFDKDYTLDVMLNEQTKMYAVQCTSGTYSPEVIKVEKLEWVGNWKGRKNDYRSDITVWVTAIVDLGSDRIVRLSYDLLDSLIMTTETGCSGHVHEPRA